MTESRRTKDEVPVNHGPRILVVDDDESVRELLSTVLFDEGYQVTTAESAEQALEYFYKDPFPLVITDLRMSGMDGLELLEKVKAFSEETQVVIITGHASLDTALQALREGVYDYLIKPIESLDIVTALVNRALDKVRLIVENQYLFKKLQANCEELEEVNVSLREISLRDGLTGLYNQRYFRQALNRELKRSSRHERSFSLLFCDIDHFKQYNDANGHIDGDEALKEFSDILLERLRQTDVACRYGGEEFIILLPETSKERADYLAKDIRSLVESHSFKGEATQPGGRLTVSIGIASFPDDAIEEVELLRLADQALYKAKDEGRNKVILIDSSLKVVTA